MRDYGKALEYAAVAADSAGTAQEKFNAAYMDSIEAKINGLTAAWEKFSMTILDSDLVKGFVTVLTGLANALTAISGWADGALVWIPAITAAVLVLITAIQRAAKSNFVVNLVKNLKGLLAIFPAVTARMQAIILNIQAETAARKHNTNALLLETKAKEASKAADVAMKATNPAGWIMLAVSAVVMITQALIKANKAAEEAKKKAKELADQARENTEAAKEETNQIKDLIDQYEELAKSNNNGLDYNAETRNKILEIQTEIVKLVGKEADGIDLINGKYEEQLAILGGLNQSQYEKQRENALAELTSAEKASQDMLIEGNEAPWYKSISGYRFQVDATEPGLKETSRETIDRLQKFVQEISEASGLQIVDDLYSGRNQVGIFGGSLSKGKNFTSADKYFGENSTYEAGVGINIDTTDSEKAYHQLTAIINVMESGGYWKDMDELYRSLISARDQVEEYATNLSSAREEVLDSTIGVLGADDVREIDSLEDFKKFREALQNDVLSDSEIDNFIKNGNMTAEDVAEAVDDWLALYASKWFDAFNEEQSSAIITSKSFLDILNEIEGEFNALDDAVKSIEENGIVSADAIRELLEEYEELEKYFQMTDQGYELGIKDPATGELWQSQDILEAYVKEYLQPYLDEVNNCEEGTEEWTTAVENYNNAIAVCATLLRAAQIESTKMWETEKENLEKDQDALEDQLDKYKEIIDLRKDLLETYEEELSYQKELKKKQENVASLQTQLAIARLDTSAAGQARVRELEQELEEAQEELDDFTLEHAVDVLTKELDDQYSEYQKFIDSQITKITEQIAKLEQAIKESTTNIEITIEGFEPIEIETDEEDKPESTKDTKKPTTSNLPKPGASIITDNRGQSPIAGGGGINQWSHLISQSHIYHSGGFVGGKAGLKSNEEFAKLMKTEFVSTPKQISNFMNKTLPAISGSGNAVQINAPLISLQCDTMSEETYPKVKSLVEQAVNKVKDQIDSVFSRTGYKNPTKFNI